MSHNIDVTLCRTAKFAFLDSPKRSRGGFQELKAISLVATRHLTAKFKYSKMSIKTVQVLTRHCDDQKDCP